MKQQWTKAHCRTRSPHFEISSELVQWAAMNVGQRNQLDNAWWERSLAHQERLHEVQSRAEGGITQSTHEVPPNVPSITHCSRS